MLDQCNEFGTLWIDTSFSLDDFFQPVIGRLDRTMRCVVRQVEKERLVVALPRPDIIARPVRKQVGRMPFRINRGRILAHIIDAVPTMTHIVVHHVAEKSVEEIESTLVRCIRRR